MILPSRHASRDGIAPEAQAANAPLITILTSSFGGGHRMAARSVAEALREERPEWDIEVLDFFEHFVGRRLSQGVAWSYGWSARRAPFVYGGVYTTAQWVGERPRLQGWMNRVGRRRLREYVRRRQPAAIVNTYPTPSAVLAALKRRGDAHTPSVTILTDWASHSQWIHEGVELYLVAHEGLRDELVGLGVPAQRVRATGVPIRAGFTPRGVYPTHGPVLITVGAHGMMRRAEALCRLVAEQAPRTVVVCGHDHSLRRRLEPLAATLGGRLQLRGFVEDIHRYYATASLFLGKPGGVTIAEAVAVGLPMVLYGAIPGQERANERFVTEAGAARAGKTATEAAATAAELMRHPEELARMAERARALGRPNAARDAAAAIVELCEGR